MTCNVNLLAWIQPLGDDEFVGAFIGGGVAESRMPRAPATHVCSSFEDARQWVEQQAAAFDLPIKWINQAE